MATAFSSAFTAHNVRLDDGEETFPEAGRTIDQLPNYACVKAYLQIVYPQGYAGKSLVDLGCLEGGFTAEFARLGLESTGIEVRESNLANARYIKRRLKLDNLHFHQDNAWNVGAYGPFDIVFCVGLYYHIEDARRFLGVMADACRKLIFIDTHFAPEADDSPAVAIHRLSPLTEHEGLQGRWYPEHDLDAARDQAELDTLKWASWENNRSFWPTKASMIEAMRSVGFDVVLEPFESLIGRPRWALSKGGWNRQNERWMLIGVKLD